MTPGFIKTQCGISRIRGRICSRQRNLYNRNILVLLSIARRTLFDLKAYRRYDYGKYGA